MQPTRLWQAPVRRWRLRLRHRILDDSGLPVVRVELDGRWRIPSDRHPDARAAHAIAEAIATRLHRSSS
jgi:hypothetical protein